MAPVVQRVDSAIHWINVYPLDNAIDFPNSYLLDIDYPLDSAIQPIEQPGPALLLSKPVSMSS